MNLSSTLLLLSISFTNRIAITRPMVPMAAEAFSSATRSATVRVKGSGMESVNKEYEWTPATIIPPGFEKVCVENRWGVESTWAMLNNGKPWLRASNDAYIYLNSADGQWWIDKPDGDGVYVAPKDAEGASIGDAGETSHISPPATGWRALSPSYNPAPSLELVPNSNKLIQS